MMKPKKLRILSALCVAIFAPGLASGAAIPVKNASFEDNALGGSAWANAVPNSWNSQGGVSGTPGPGAPTVDGANNLYFLEKHSAIGVSGGDGLNNLGLRTGGYIYQDLGVLFQPNTTYTVDIMVNRRGAANNVGYFGIADSTVTLLGTPGATNSSQIGTSNQFFAVSSLDPAAGNVATYTTGATVPAGNVILAVGATTGNVVYDLVSVDATPIEPDGSAEIGNSSASAITSTTATLNGTVTSIGDAAPSITIFYGILDGGVDALAWDSSINLSGTHNASFSENITGLTYGQSYFFTARATNSAGVSWAIPSGSFETLPIAPSVTQSAPNNITANTARLTGTITDSGGDTTTLTFYYGTSDGGTTVGNWSNSISLGATTGSANADLTGLTSTTSYFYRALATNSAGSTWASSTESFTTLTVTPPVIYNRSVDALSSTSASLRGEVTDTGSSIPTVTLYFGTTDGLNNPNDWDASINVGAEGGNFNRFVSGLTPETSYYYTSRAVNSAGTSWAPSSETFDTPESLPNQVVINEIHYDPADETSRAEFIELYNPGATPIDLSGWLLTDAVEYTFPVGTTIAAGAYLVVAEDPATILSVFGETALGPWTGGLNNDGEEIDLRNAAGVLMDQVDYGVGFPWPSGARGGGGSMELLNPALDNDLSGSWRTSGAQTGTPSTTTYVAASGDWKYFKGISEASSPVNAWRQTSYNDTSWTSGQTPLGYGDGDDNTVLGDMQNNYTSVFMRREFIVSPLDIPTSLKLRIYADDGAIVWINGQEVKRVHVPAGQLAYNSTGSNHEAAWEEFTLTGTSAYLVGGTNIIAVQGFNGTQGSSDFSLDASLETSSGGGDGSATPGQPNSSTTNSPPPAIRQVEHLPAIPTSSDPVTITAKITDPQGVGTVSLDYQVVDPGSYIRITDASYDSGWISVPMNDDGINGDAFSSDSTYTAVLPASVQQHRRLIRYRINFEDANGSSDTAPYADDEQPNFAYFTYNGVPSWTGSFTPSTTNETFPSTLMDDLPIYHLLARAGDVTSSQYGGADGVHQKGTLIYDGKVYDHIDYENRGEASTYVSGKNKWRFHFNRAHRFKPRDNWGKKYGESWSKLNLQSISSPWAAVNRGMAGLDEAPAMRLYGMAGVPSPRTHYFSFRVIDASAEASGFSQYEGDLWGLYLAMEHPNGSFLDERDLPDGNIYKIEGGGGDKKEQGSTQVTNSSDWSSFYSSSNSAQTEQWWRDNMHMPGYYSLRALNRLLGNVDIRIGYNHYFYHEPTEDKWHVMPWDLDMMYIAETHQAGVIRQQNSINSHSQLALEFRNRSREILDLVASDDSTTGGQIGQLIDEYTQIVNPTGQAQTWADIDAFMWNRHPRTRGSLGSTSGQSNHLGNFYRTPYTDSRGGGSYTRILASSDHEGFVNHIVKYTTDNYSGGSWSPGNGVPAGYGFEYLKRESNDSSIPNRPTLTYSGPAGYPVDQLTFGSGSFSDPNGGGTFGKMRWRIAKVLAPGLAGYEPGTPRTYEIETVATSPDFTTFTSSYTFPPDLIEPATTYRVRVQHEDATGRTSHWSEPSEFVASTPNLDLWKDNLVISEIMYNPRDPVGSEALVSSDNDDFEFIELTNISDSLTLDLSDLGFTSGITFDFSGASSTTLAPGASVLLVKNVAAFQARYGTGLPVIGTYPSSLSNGGEQIVLSFALNSPIFDFTYDDNPPWATSPDGGGYALVLVAPETAPNHALAASWTAGASIDGTPGTLEPASIDYDTWLGEHFTAGQIADPGTSGPNANPDGDSLINLLEYAFLTDPLVDVPIVEILQSGIIQIGGDTFLTLTYPRRNSSGDLTYLPQISNDLATWRDGPDHLVEVSSPDQGDGSSLVTVRSTLPISTGDKEFIRLRVTRTAP